VLERLADRLDLPQLGSSHSCHVRTRRVRGAQIEQGSLARDSVGRNNRQEFGKKLLATTLPGGQGSLFACRQLERPADNKLPEASPNVNRQVRELVHIGNPG